MTRRPPTEGMRRVGASSASNAVGGVIAVWFALLGFVAVIFWLKLTVRLT